MRLVVANQPFFATQQVQFDFFALPANHQHAYNASDRDCFASPHEQLSEFSLR